VGVIDVGVGVGVGVCVGVFEGHNPINTISIGAPYPSGDTSLAQI
jgi:hypothetical protein